MGKERLDEIADPQISIERAIEISKATNLKGMSCAADATIQGGNIAKNAREALEAQIGHSVISPLNANTPNLLDDKQDPNA